MTFEILKWGSLLCFSNLNKNNQPVFVKLLKVVLLARKRFYKNKVFNVLKSAARHCEFIVKKITVNYCFPEIKA